MALELWKGTEAGKAISAREYNRICRAVFEATGTGGVRVSVVNGHLQVDGSGVGGDNHPFKISAEFDDATTPTVCLVNIYLGTLQGTLASGSTYAGVPLFEGSGGTALDADPVPVFDIGVTARVSSFYFVVTTDEFGLVDTVWIERFLAADLPLVEVPYVQPDFPDVGDAGSAGTYYWLIGTVTVAEAAGVFSLSISQGVETSMGFFTCGAGGRFYRA